jgi:WD40 repeat protein
MDDRSFPRRNVFHKGVAMIRFACPTCKVAASAPEECAGRTTTCRQCGNPITVPSVAAQSAAPPPAARTPSAAPKSSTPPKVAAKPNGRDAVRRPGPSEAPLPRKVVAKPRAIVDPRHRYQKDGEGTGSNWLGVTAAIVVMVLVTGGICGFFLYQHSKPKNVEEEQQASLTDKDKGKSGSSPREGGDSGKNDKNPADNDTKRPNDDTTNPVKPPDDKTDPVKPPDDKTNPVKPPDDKTEPTKPPDDKTDPVKPPDDKTNPVKPPDDKTNPVKPPEPANPAKEPVVLACGPFRVQCLALSKDGKLLAAGTSLGERNNQASRVIVWDLASGKEKLNLETAGYSDVNAIAFSPDGKTLATGGHDSTQGKREARDLRFFDLESGKEKPAPKAPAGVNALAFSPDGKRLAAGGLDKAVTVWDLPSGKQSYQIKDVHRYDLAGLAFALDGKVLVSTGSTSTDGVVNSFKGELKLWDAANGKERNAMTAFKAPIRRYAISSDGKTIAAGGQVDGDQSLIKLWDAASGQEATTIKGPLKEVSGVAFSPDDKVVAACYYDNTIHLFEVDGGKEIANFQGHVAMAKAVLFTPDGRTLISGGEDKTVKLWDLNHLPSGDLAKKPIDPPRQPKPVETTTYKNATIFKVEGNNVILRVGEKSFEEYHFCVAKDTVYLDAKGDKQSEEDAVKVFRVTNVVDAKVGKRTGIILEMKLVKEGEPLPGAEMAFKGGVVKSADANMAVVTVDGRDYRAFLADATKVYDQEGKQLEGDDRFRVLQVGNVFDGKFIHAGEIKHFAEIRLVKFKLRDPGPKVEMIIYKDVLVVKGRGGALSFKIGDRIMKMPPNQKILDQDGKEMSLVDAMKDGNTFELKVEKMEGGLERPVEARLMKKGEAKQPPDKTDPDKKPDPKTDAADEAKFLGTWKDPNEAVYGKSYWIIKKEKDEWSVTGVSFKDGKRTGLVNSKNCKFKDGTLTFVQDWVQKPDPTWINGTEITAKVDGDRLDFTWKNGQLSNKGMLKRSDDKLPELDKK